MKQQEVFKKIGTIIKELNDQYGYLSETEDGLNNLELELFVANARFLADHSEVLQKLNLQYIPAPVIIPLPKIVKEENYFEPVVQHTPSVIETKEEDVTSPHTHTPAKLVINKPVDDTPVPHIDLGGNGADDDFSYTRQEPETIRHELTLEDIPNWEEDDDDENFVNEELIKPIEKPFEVLHVEVAKPDPVKPDKETAPAEATIEHTHEEPMTINQRMSAQLNHTGSLATEHSNLQPIADLRQAITLNDKLLYIKDLFNGYNLAYSEAIDILNRFSTFDEAEKFLQSSYIVKNDWASKQGTADKFYELLKRRYS